MAEKNLFVKTCYPHEAALMEPLSASNKIPEIVVVKQEPENILEPNRLNIAEVYELKDSKSRILNDAGTNNCSSAAKGESFICSQPTSQSVNIGEVHRVVSDFVSGTLGKTGSGTNNCSSATKCESFLGSQPASQSVNIGEVHRVVSDFVSGTLGETGSGTNNCSSVTKCESLLWRQLTCQSVNIGEVTRVVSDFVSGKSASVKKEVEIVELPLEGHEKSATRNATDGLLCVNAATAEKTNCTGSKTGITDRRTSGRNAKKSVRLSEKIDVNDFVDDSDVDSNWTRTEDPPMYKCTICEAKTYNRIDKMRDHIRAHLGVKPFACNVDGCDAAYVNIYSLHQHIKRHNSPRIKCKFCDRTFSNNGSSLAQHMNVHNDVKPHQCEACEKSFHSKWWLSQHLQVEHGLPSNLSKQCEICGAVLSSASSLNMHMHSVHFKTSVRCKLCDRRFTKASLLKEHMRLHKNDSFTCRVCSKAFTSVKLHRQHERRHFSSWKCDKCDKVFKSSSFLKGHLLQHDGIREHCCKVCGQTFVHKHYLWSHMKSHREKIFVCDFCGGKFNRKDNLKSHIIRHLQAKRKNLKEV